jgi:glyoxylase-like metal-dependent hydrolase (beta-lactamase superfamily II)
VTFLLWAVPVLAQDINEAATEGDLVQVKAWVLKDPSLVNLKDDNGSTPLHWASRGVHLEILEYLVKNGANVNASDNDAVRPIHSLSYRGDTGAMEILIKEGADLDVKEINGMTPLMYAVYDGKDAAVNMLLKYGARLDARDESGLTVADIAKDQGHEKLAQYLLTKGAVLTPVADPVIVQLAANIHEITFCYQQCTNMLVIDDPDEVLVIDSGYPRTKDKLKSAINNIAGGKKVTIINTHQHYDHIGGNSVAGDEGNIIAYENLEQMVSKGIINKNDTGLQGASGKYYEGDYSLKLADQMVRLIPLNGAHTDGDLAIYIENAGIVHMGDILISQSFPSLTRGKKIDEYMTIFEKVVDIFDEQTIFVGGHGRNLNKGELVAYQDMLKETIDIVIKGLHAGKTASSMQQDGVLNNYLAYDTFIPQLNSEYWIGAISKNYQDTVPGSE